MTPPAPASPRPLTLGSLGGLLRAGPRGCSLWAAGGLASHDWTAALPARSRPWLCRSAAASDDGAVASLGPAGLALWPAGTLDPDCSPERGEPALIDVGAEAGPLAMAPAGDAIALVVGGEVVVLERRAGRVDPGAPRLRWAAPGPVLALAFSPDGERLAAAGGGPRGPGWCALLDRGGEVARGATPAAVQCVAFAPDGRWLAGGGRHVTLWNLRGQSEGALDAQPGDVAAVAASASGLAAVGYRGGPVALWRLGPVARGAYAGGVDGHRRTVRSLAFVAGGAALASAGDDQAVMLWEPPATPARRRLEVGTGPIESLAASDARLALGLGDGTAQVWALPPWPPGSPSAPLLAVRPGGASFGPVLERTLGQHPGGLFAAAWSPDGRRLVTAGGDGRLRLWSARRGELRGEASGQGQGQGVAFAPDGRAVLVADEGGLGRWPLPLASWLPGLAGVGPRSARPAAAARLPSSPGPLGPCRSLAVAGALVAAGGADGRVHLGDGASAGRAVPALGSAAWALALSPSEPLLAAGGEGELALVDTRFGERVLRRPIDGGRVGALAFSPDGRTLAVASADGLVRLLAVDSGQVTPLARSHGGELTAALWGPGGLLTASRDGLLVRWVA